MDPIERHNVKVTGLDGAQPILFAHGFGCSQQMWRYVAPHFESRFQVALFDWIGYGGSDPSAYDPDKYSTLDGYAQDVLEICEALDLQEVIFVGHSVAAIIGVLAAIKQPERFTKLVLVCPSPRYIDDDAYVGGFGEKDIDELLESLESNYLGWSSAMAPVVMGNEDRPELSEELEASFCRADPKIARQFAEVTFRSDNRADLPQVAAPCLVLQCSKDVIAPTSVGEYVHATLPNSVYVMLDATGHCPNLSAPVPTTRAIDAFIHD